MMVFLGRIYIYLRRAIRSLVVNNSFLNQLIGNRLRKIDSSARLWQKLIPVSEAGRIRFGDSWLNYTKDDLSTIYTLLMNNEYSPEIVDALKEILQPGMTFVDIGANIGYISLIAAQIVGETGRVYAFEPIPRTAKTLKLNVSQNGLDNIITIEQKAIARETGFVSFIVPAGESVGARIIQSSHSIESIPESMVDIEATSLDEYFGNIGWPSIDLIKIDIEGAEIFAFEGMKRLSDQNPNLSIIFEYSRSQQHNMGVSHEQLFESIKSCGFTHIRLLTPGYNEEHWDISTAIPKIQVLAKQRHLDLLCEKNTNS